MWPQLWHNLVDASSGGQWHGAGAASTLLMERSQDGSCVGGARMGGDMGRSRLWAGPWQGGVWRLQPGQAGLPVQGQKE